MRRKKQFTFAWLLPFIIIASACGHSGPENGGENDGGMVKVTYKESDEAIINPERGFYNYNSFSTKDDNVLTAEQVKRNRNAGRSLMLNLYYLYDFRDKPISSEFLNRIEINMKALREGGGKCVLRFAYSDSEGDKPWDAPLDLVLQHIEQLKPYLTHYADVIFAVEAGFIGAWGEWYYTDHFNMNPQTPQDYVPRKKVLEALLNALPKERMVCVRTPAYKLHCFNIGYPDTITAAKAYNGSLLSRIGSHNDCFLASSNDVGTFHNSQERTFWESETKYTVMGGETCGLSSYSACENALLQMEKYHWSYLNSDYHPSVLSDWRTKGCFEEISKRMGYRFVATEGEFTKEPRAGEKWSVKLKIKNVGFAAPVNPRNAELLLVPESETGETFTIKIETDPRKWFAGEEQSLDVTHTLPPATKDNKYAVYLNLPDPASTLSVRPEYSIRMANQDMWEAETGYNRIHTIAVR
ncbi:DUF4832 domain-containing protein [Proteiniphilum sp. X52]|uniref:DUF4832 domain-containing protein n=1 Tax=Proteiniphilum sp. X52 TaxID=2382159 RepID=UPI000F0A4C51|nr:DUF4832 domain-containing protein [Proteiniphilum sp. X52]RNC66236.1 DUF4832 domain-containing protein [Proteiniphilum sp. X52]